MTWIATEGCGLYPAPETLGFVPMLGTPTETRICSPTWLCGGWRTIQVLLGHADIADTTVARKS